MELKMENAISLSLPPRLCELYLRQPMLHLLHVNRDAASFATKTEFLFNRNSLGPSTAEHSLNRQS